MAATPNCQLIEAAVLAKFPDAEFGRYNCRHISSNPLRPWSQHAGSESNRYFGNALDITHQAFGYNVTAVHTAWLRTVYGFLRTTFPDLVDQLLGPGDRGHSDHVHVSTWPKMRSSFWYRPPCKGGKLVVIYEDGTTGNTFGDTPSPPPPPEEEEMALKQGDVGNAVAYYQKAINAWGGTTAIPVNGIFNTATETAVKAYQNAADLDKTGIIDGVTADLIGRYHPDRQAGTHNHDLPDITGRTTK